MSLLNGAYSVLISIGEFAAGNVFAFCFVAALFILAFRLSQ